MAEVDKRAAGLVTAWQFLRENPDLQRARKAVEGTRPPQDFVLACTRHKDLVRAMKSAGGDEMARLLEEFERERVDECRECRLILALGTDDPSYLLDP